MLCSIRNLTRILQQNTFRQFSAVSFDSLVKQNKLLANNLQKIAEADRHFVTYEPEICDVQSAIDDLDEMYECCDGDEESQKITQQELEKSYLLTKEMEQNMNANRNPFTTAFLDLHSGAGGEDANDWTHMLLTMYQHFAANMNWKCKLLSCQYEGEGIRSATLRLDGETIAPYLACETGIHRLVRISPFDKNNRRHTSFASVILSPLSEQNASITIQQKDLIVDRFRASGPGGQHVNKTESAVRLTHIPTGIVAECQAERSQHQNMEMALDLLKSKLLVQQQEKEKETKKLEYQKRDDNSWSNQIRSYVLHPYTIVKDHRYDVSDSDVKRILDGDLKEFIDELLLNKMYTDFNVKPL